MIAQLIKKIFKKDNQNQIVEDEEIIPSSSFNIIDFHSHFLPKMDDGSKSIEESINMLEDSYLQGIKTFISTSHFYPSKEDPSSFLKRREESYNYLLKVIESSSSVIKNNINIHLGAEVAFYQGISTSNIISSLVIEGSNKYILIEMPFYPWREEEIEEIINLKRNLGLNVVLAHVDRYLNLGFKDYLNILVSNGILFQWNAESFLDERIFKKIKNYYLDGYVYFLGSDMHNIEDRRPNLGKCINLLNKIDPSLLERIEGYQEFLFNKSIR